MDLPSFTNDEMLSIRDAWRRDPRSKTAAVLWALLDEGKITVEVASRIARSQDLPPDSK